MLYAIKKEGYQLALVTFFFVVSNAYSITYSPLLFTEIKGNFLLASK